MCMSGGSGPGIGGYAEDAGLAIGDYFTGGALTPALIATVAGQAATTIAQAQQLNKQNDIAAAGIIDQGNLQKQGEGDVASLTKTISQETPQQKTAQQLSAYQKALQQSAPISNSDQPGVPGAGSAYKKEAASAGAGASNYVNALAKSGATIEGTQLERVQEGQQLGNTASQLGLLSQQSDEQSYLTKLQIQGTQANPWLMALGTAAKAYGSMASMGAGWGAGGAAAANADAGAAVANEGASIGAAGGYTGLGAANYAPKIVGAASGAFGG